MCRKVTCRKCGKAGWAGCGAHVEQVLGDVPAADRCRCDEVVAAAPATGGRPSWLQRVLGR